MHVGVAKEARLNIGETADAPDDGPVADGKESLRRCFENDPAHSRKEPNLEVPRLEMHKFKEVGLPDTKTPSLGSEGLYFFGWNVIPDTLCRVLHSVRAADRPNLLETGWRRFGIPTFALRNDGVSPILIEVPHREASRSSPRQISGHFGRNRGTAPWRRPAKPRRANAAGLSTSVDRKRSSVDSRSAKAPGPSNKPRDQAKFFGERRAIVFSRQSPTQTQGSAEALASGSVNPRR